MQKRILWLAIFLMAFATTALADWSRDIPYQDSEPATPHFQYLGIQGIHDGPVVADVVTTWPGKEILQATRTSIWIMSADNLQTPMELTIPAIQEPDGNCQVGGGPYEFIAGQPAVGDVDGDGINEIVVGITYMCEHDLSGGDTLLNYYGSVVWWTWNGTSFDPHSLRLEDAGVSYAFLGTPTICRTQWTNGHPTVVFWGPSSLQVTAFRHSSYILTAFDLSDTLTPTAVQREVAANVTDAQVTWARGSGIYVQAADLNGDGYDELIAHNDMIVYRFDWNFAFFLGTVLDTVPAGNAFQSGYGTIADVNADGALEYLVSYSPLAPPLNGRLVQFDPVPNATPTYYGDLDQNPYPIVGTQPGVCDLSSSPISQETPEGRLSPITTTRHDSRMYNSATGALRSPAWPNPQIYDSTDQRNVSNPALAYVTGAVVQPQFIKVDIGYPTVGTDEIRVYDPITGNVVYSANLNVPSLFTTDTYSAVTSSPVYSDLDGNGQGSFITSFRTAADTLRILRTDPGQAFNPELAEWSQTENGPKHTGLYAQPVSGTQPLTDIKWSGKIIVYDDYDVPTGSTLTIEPGTVVELRPDASLTIEGTLSAEGKDNDSIYFRPIGGSSWGSIVLDNATNSILDKCVIHGGDGVTIRKNEGLDSTVVRNCHLYNMKPGINLENVDEYYHAICRNNLIESCSNYGLCGTLSGGTYSYNLIQNCGRAGIFWYGDAGCQFSGHLPRIRD